MTTPKSFVTRAVAMSLLVLAAGCASEPQFAEQPYVDGGPDAAPPPPPPPVQDAAAPPATATPCDSTMTLAMTNMIQARSAGEAPGMKPDGAAVCAVVPEGQTFSSPTMMLQPGFCYTVVGQSVPGVTEVDLSFELDLAGGGTLPPALQSLQLKPVLAVDTDAGPTATIGAKQNCYKWAWPIPAAVKVVLKARTGSGPVAAQVYSKKKP
jgi:hypothetical protein